DSGRQPVREAADVPAAAAVVHVGAGVDLTAVGAAVIAFGVRRAANVVADAAAADRRRVSWGRADNAAGAAVVGVPCGVLAEAGAAGLAGRAVPGGAASAVAAAAGLAVGTLMATCATVVRVREQIDLTTIRGDAVAVAVAGGAGEAAGSSAAG